MTKYIVMLLALIFAGGLFLYTSQTAQAPTVEPVSNQDPFGTGSAQVGTLETTNSASPEQAAPEATGVVPIHTGVETGSTVPPATPEKTASGAVSRTELVKHNTQSNCWVAYKGVVYDITNWLPRHPGSAEAIAPYCGTAEEFAAAFNRQHGTSREGKLKQEGINEGTFSN